MIEQIRDALETSGFDGRLLTIEVTETALMLDMAAVVRDLRTIKQMGVSIAIDDFGTGYSSLSSLRELPVDCLKIDQSFITSITTSDESMALVRTFIQLGHRPWIGDRRRGSRDVRPDGSVAREPRQLRAGISLLATLGAPRARRAPPRTSPPHTDKRHEPARTALPGRLSYSSSFNAATNASWGTSTRPRFFMRFLPSFCFSRSLRFLVMSPP